MLRALVLTLISLVVATPSTTAGGKVALVIGNSTYLHTPALRNPARDAGAVAAALRNLGFKVVEGRDLSKLAMDRTIIDFSRQLRKSDVGLFFYAGHGLQVGLANYLVPIDAKLDDPSGIDFELIRVESVQRLMEGEARTSILFLDACRDNPLSRNLARTLGTRGGGQIGRGLAPMEAGVGTLISFSTQPGNVALDGDGPNSPYAAALSRELSDPKDDISTLLISVRNQVMAATKDRQVPWEHSSLRAKFYFRTPTPPIVPKDLETLEKAVKDAEDAKTKLLQSEKDRVAALKEAESSRLALEEARKKINSGGDLSVDSTIFDGDWIGSWRDAGSASVKILGGKVVEYMFRGKPQAIGASQISGKTIKFGTEHYKVTLTLTAPSRLSAQYSNRVGDAAAGILTKKQAQN